MLIYNLLRASDDDSLLMCLLLKLKDPNGDSLLTMMKEGVLQVTVLLWHICL